MRLQREVVRAFQVAVGSRFLRLADVCTHVLHHGFIVVRKFPRYAAQISFRGIDQLRGIQLFM